MLRRITIFFVALFFLYALFVQFDASDTVYLHSNPWFDNAINIETYYFDEKRSKNVITGSSLSLSLNSEEIFNDSYNLSLAGLNSILGLEVIIDKEPYPKIVMVELNRLIINKNNNFENYLYNPVTFFLKRHFKVFRTKYQPIRYIGCFSLLVHDKILYEYRKFFGEVKPSIKTRYFVQPKVLEKSEILNEEVVLEKANKLIDLLQKLNSHGVEIILFTMPSKTLDGSPSDQLILSKMRDVCKEENYHWIEPYEQKYTTYDGVHLTHESAKIYAAFIREQLKEKGLLK